MEAADCESQTRKHDVEMEGGSHHHTSMMARIKESENGEGVARGMIQQKESERRNDIASTL